MTPSERRGWERFEDWCLGTGRRPLPADVGTVTTFFSRITIAPSTEAAWRTAIRKAHQVAGVPSPVRQPEPKVPVRSSPVREGPAWLGELDEALRRCERRGLAGLYGRRDALVLVLRVAGISRRRIRDLTPSDVDLDAWAVADEPLGTTDEPTTCPRCVLVRWLDVLGPLHHGVRSVWQDEVLAARTPAERHDCARGPAWSWWRAALCLLPPINQHRQMDDRGLSAEAVRRISARRQSVNAPEVVDGGVDERPVIRRGVSVAELKGELADLEAQLDALFEQMEARAGTALRADAERWGDDDA